MQENKTTLKVHSIESFGTHDGPGIRMVIFTQGCNLKCLYCQNADTIPYKGGEEYALEDLVKRAINMKSYFGSDGGVTVSGGEPLVQNQAIIELFQLLKAEGIHTNIDTNGTINNKNTQLLISELSDLIMFDVKHTQKDGFNKLVGFDGLSILLKNVALREKSKKPYWLRYVLVPGYTDDDASLQMLIENFSQNKYLEKLEALPYHKLGQHKWEMLNWEYQLGNVNENTPENLKRVENILSEHFTDVSIR